MKRSIGWLVIVLLTSSSLRIAHAQDNMNPVPITAENAASVVELNTLEGHEGSVASVAFNAEGTILASAGDDHQIHLWDMNSGEAMNVLEGGLAVAYSLAFTVDGALLAIPDLTIDTFLTTNNVPVRWDIETGESQPFTTESFLGSRLALSPDGQLLAVDACGGSMDISANGLACSNYDILLMDVATGEKSQTIGGAFGGPTRMLTFSPDGTLLASASADGTTKLWDVATGEALFTLQALDQQIVSAIFSPDGSMLATSSGDGMVWLFDVVTGDTLTSFQAHEGIGLGLAFNGDGTVLATSGGDQVIRLWDVATQTELVELEGNTDAVWGLAFSPDSTLLASAGLDATVRLWGVAGDSAASGETGNITDKWVVAVDEVESATEFEDAFMTVYAPAEGSTFLVVNLTVTNQNFDASVTLPKGDQLLYGVWLYGNGLKPVPWTFVLGNISLLDSTETSYSLMGFGMPSLVLVDSHLASFSVAASSEQASFTLLFSVSSDSVSQPYSLIFEDLAPIEFALP